MLQNYDLKLKQHETAINELAKLAPLLMSMAAKQPDADLEMTGSDLPPNKNQENEDPCDVDDLFANAKDKTNKGTSFPNIIFPVVKRNGILLSCCVP